jgi:hypothetical protein
MLQRFFSLLMFLFPLFDTFLVPLALAVVAVLAQGLKVRPVEEPLLAADGPGCDVIHAGGGPDDTVAIALRTQRMLCPERP